MYLLTTSVNHSTLIQLATGFGKSLMLAIMAKWINTFHNKKVIIVVPSPFLHAYQEHFYCPTAWKVPEDISEPTIKQIFFCSFERFNKAEFTIPADTTILVDEFHDLFFNQSATIINWKLQSVVLKLQSASKLIGVSATFRNEVGVKKINDILAPIFLQSPLELKERILNLEVFGKVKDVPAYAVELAREKAKKMPVILFCLDPIFYQQLLPEADVFDRHDIGIQMATVKNLLNMSKGIVLTTSAASKGVDFLFAVPQAYIIHTVLPDSLVKLKQDSGRGVRRSDLPIIGAIITQLAYADLKDVELGLSFNQQFEQLYSPDYLASHTLLTSLPVATTGPQQKALKYAINALNAGKTCKEIAANFAKTDFKKYIPSHFKQSIPSASMYDQQAQTKQQVIQKESTEPSNYGHQQQVHQQDQQMQTLERQKNEESIGSHGSVLGKRMQPEPVKGCGHKLKSKFKNINKEIYCDNCATQNINLQKEHWNCAKCDFDLCSACHMKRTQPTLSSMFAGSAKRQKFNHREEEKSAANCLAMHSLEHEIAMLGSDGANCCICPRRGMLENRYCPTCGFTFCLACCTSAPKFLETEVQSVGCATFVDGLECEFGDNDEHMSEEENAQLIQDQSALKDCIVPYCGAENEDLCKLSCCKKLIHESCWKKNVHAQTLGLATGPMNELKASMNDRKKAPKTCPHCRSTMSALLLEFNEIQFKILKNEQVECMFLNCFGVTARENAVAHSFTHIARLSDMKVKDSRTSSAIPLGEVKQQSEVDDKMREMKQQKSQQVIENKIKSVASSKRSTTGKFDGGTKFGYYVSIKNSMKRDEEMRSEQSQPAFFSNPNHEVKLQQSKGREEKTNSIGINKMILEKEKTKGKWSSNRSTKTGEYPCKVEVCGKIFTTAQLRSQHQCKIHTRK